MGNLLTPKQHQVIASRLVDDDTNTAGRDVLHAWAENAALGELLLDGLLEGTLRCRVENGEVKFLSSNLTALVKE
jgi:hypothetical protein